MPTLDAYEQQLLQANQSLVAARDRLDQARSLARVATADMFPQLSADPSAVRERGSGNRPLNGAATHRREWRSAVRSALHAERLHDSVLAEL